MKANRLWEIGTAGAAFVILIYVLVLHPVVGMADNGDFLRIMTTVGLDYLNPSLSYEDKYFGNFIRQFQLVPLGLGAYASTQVVLVIAATWLNKLLYSTEVFDMRFLGAVYGLLLMAAFYTLVRYQKKRSLIFNLALAALLLFVFADSAYTAYFNSLFGEPVSFVFLLLTAGLAIGLTRSEKPSRKLLILFFLCAIFMVGSKIQNAPIGVLMGLYGLRFLRFRPDQSWRRTVIGFSIFLLAGSAAMYVFAPKQLKEINMYQTVFYGVVKDSPTPEADLEELGVDPKLAVLAGTNFFTPNTPIPQRDPVLYESFYNHMSHSKIAWFYLKHPVRLIGKLDVAAQNGMTIRPYYLGTYEKSEGLPRGTVTEKYNVWSELKHKWMPNRFYHVLLFLIVYLAVLTWEYVRARSLRSKVYLELFALIAAAGAISFLIPVIGDGEADLAKHLFLFNVCFDMMLVASVLWIVHKLTMDEEEAARRLQR